MRDVPHEPADEDVEALLAEILALPPRERAAAEAAVTAERPEVAEELRSRMAFLRDAGFLPDSRHASPDPTGRLEIGASLAGFEILEFLGAGGMGEVYRALDRELDREVAIKVLPRRFASDRLRMKRFEREARALASLNHGNVAQVHRLDRSGATAFLVMELVGGENLEQRLARGRMEIEEAIDVGRQIAEGLEAAHEAGVVHRDLKPANIALTTTGEVKILDFGLAKARETRNSGRSGEDESVVLTGEGSFLGTPIYMSPEQIQGRTVDRRSDLWAYGCVLFECLSGKRAFPGTHLGELSAKILSDEPDWTALPTAVDGPLLWLLRRCFAKDPRLRLQDAGEARVLLSGSWDAPSPVGTREGAEDRRAQGWRALPWVIAAAALAWVAVSGRLARRGTPPLTAALELAVPTGRDAALVARTYANLALSRDGSRIAWIGGSERTIHVRELASFGVRALEGTEGSASPFFSPSGEWVGYFQGDRLFKAHFSDGARVELVDEAQHQSEIRGYATQNRGGTWTDDDGIVFSPSVEDGLFRVDSNGANFERLTSLDPTNEERTHRWPDAIGGTNSVLFTVDDHTTTEEYDDASIVVVSLDDGSTSVAQEGASFARWTNGALVYSSAGSLYARSFDASEGRCHGDAALLRAGVSSDPGSGASQFAVAGDGSLLFASAEDQRFRSSLVLRGADGRSETLGAALGVIIEPSLSRAGDQVAYVLREPEGHDIWLLDLVRGTPRRVTTGQSCSSPIWSADGSRLAFFSRNPAPWGMYWTDVAGSGRAELLMETTTDRATPYAFLEDGSGLLFHWRRDATKSDIGLLRLPSREVEEWIATAADEIHPAPSKNGRWLAYSSNASDRFEVYLQELDSRARRLQVSVDGGTEPRWSPDGHTLYYLVPKEQELWAVDVDFGAEAPALSAPRRVLDRVRLDADARFNYQVTREGRFLSTATEASQEMGLQFLRFDENAVSQALDADRTRR